ncbi:MAG TPA: response regulator transcription factor [Chloroflexaceae bacterium]|nr:response regulator transcription factor [Chloroflexaceae bacterium]
MKILLVDDDTTLAEVTAFALRRAGFLVIIAHNGLEALEVWERERPDLLILDVQLPGKDGLDLCREIRQTSMVPIIMLTVRGGDDDIVQGLELGADDYMPKPFSPRQLIARVRALLRRSQSVPRQARLALHDLVLDTGQQAVQTPQGTIRLTPMEFRLLHYLLVNRGQVVPTDTILTHVWGYADSGDRTLLKQLIYRLRQKIEPPDAAGQYIETIPGVGYTIRELPDAPAEVEG